jgi:hypothetical protein
MLALYWVFLTVVKSTWKNFEQTDLLDNDRLKDCRNEMWHVNKKEKLSTPDFRHSYSSQLRRFASVLKKVTKDLEVTFLVGLTNVRSQFSRTYVHKCRVALDHPSRVGMDENYQ